MGIFPIAFAIFVNFFVWLATRPSMGFLFAVSLPGPNSYITFTIDFKVYQDYNISNILDSIYNYT